MSDPQDFPVRWHRELIADARKRLADVEKTAVGLKQASNYRRAFQVVIAMRRASLAAMLTIPEPQAGEVYKP